MSREANLLGALALAVVDELQRVASDAADLTLTDSAVLNVVGQTPGCSVRHVSEVLAMTHGGAVRAADRLAVAGLLGRDAGADGRTVALTLTHEGGRRWARQTAQRRARLDRLLGAVDPDGRAAVTAALEAMLAASTPSRELGEHICRLCDEARCPQPRCPVTLAAAADLASAQPAADRR